MTIAVSIVAILVWRGNRPQDALSADAAPTTIEAGSSRTRSLAMGEVLDMAKAARQSMSQTLDDYTARFVKQEVDASGVLGEETELHVKVRTRFRGEGEQAPMQVYLKFARPESVNGREVVWVEDMNEGKMAVHENYFPLSLKTIWLDPNGFLAMQGQRYPISEVGLVRLVEKLIERGEVDRDNPDIKVTITRDHVVGDTPAELIQVRRSKPGGGTDDYSLAEIAIDPARQLILSYRSFGWPEESGAAAPLLESYSYYDVKTNVGLTDADFDPSNPSYAFP